MPVERTVIYKLEQIYDVPAYEGFWVEPAFDRIFRLTGRVEYNDGQWTPRRFGETWKPPRVIGRVRKFNDYPCIGTTPAFSERAVQGLRDLLEPNGELLPLISDVGQYYFYNVLTQSDALNAERSEISASKINRYEFVPDKLKGLVIFRLAQDPIATLVTNAFAARARQHGLKGMIFTRLWPLPPGIKWWDLFRKQQAAEERKGAKKGGSVTGNSVIIRLPLHGNGGIGSEEERKRIDRIMDELDAILINAESDAPAVGDLDNWRYEAGACQLALSCPDADALVEVLRPILRKLDWPQRPTVFKKYSEWFDAEAPEKLVEGI